MRNLVLFGQPQLNTTLTGLIHSQLARVGLPHTFSEDATALILRASEGTLKAVKNLCIGVCLEAVRDRSKTVELKQVNAALIQPHWRHNSRDEPEQPLVTSNQKRRQSTP